MYHVSVNRTQLGHTADYEGAVKEMFAAASKGGFGAPIMGSSSMSDPGVYTFIVPISSWGDLDGLYASWNKITADNAGVFAKANEITTSTETSVWMARPDLSYVPGSPRLTAEEAAFGRWRCTLRRDGVGVASLPYDIPDGLAIVRSERAAYAVTDRGIVALTVAGETSG